jgi:hypothetical protein
MSEESVIYRSSTSTYNGGRYNDIIRDTNGLLAAVNIEKKINSVEELSRVASSMFVAVFEAFFKTRLDNIYRNPQSHQEYSINAQRVIDALSVQIQMDLQHITGSSIASGEIRAISYLIHILAQVVFIAR